MGLNVLYLSAHSILEYDEMRLFTELGYEVFALGSYIDPHAPVDPKRPPIKGASYYPKLHRAASVDSKNNLEKELVDWADVIFVQHRPDWILKNWQKIKDKAVIWRSIGQSTSDTERLLKMPRSEGLKVVRYSPMEYNIPGFIGSDAIIRFYKDPEEFVGWNGERRRVMTVSQSMRSRGAFCHFDLFNRVTYNLPRVLYGPGNEDAGQMWGGCPDYEALKDALRRNRVFFYTGTQPASYTLGFIEAFMTGIPIVAIGPKWANSIFGREMKTYEVDSIIENGVNGFVHDNERDMRDSLQALLDDPDMAAHVGHSGRETAITLFGKEMVRDQWQKFLGTLRTGF